MAKLPRFLNRTFLEQAELRVDVARAFRAAAAAGVPLIVCHLLHRPDEALFVSMAAMVLSLPDLRGAYRIRLRILAGMTVVAAAAAFLGALTAPRLSGAVAAMGLIAALGGLWRHVSADYGPSMSVSSALLFLFGLAQPGGGETGAKLAGLVALGGAMAVLLHVVEWLIHPQFALRYAVAETWVAASDLVAAMRPKSVPDKPGPDESLPGKERELRNALDRTFLILGEAKNRRQAALIEHLEAMRREVVHFSMRAIAFNASIEPLRGSPGFSRHLPVVDSVLKTLADAARSVALTLIVHRPENFAASNVRLRRCAHLARALDEEFAARPGDNPAIAEVRAALAQILGVLPRVRAAVGATTDHSRARPGFSAGLPDIGALSVKSLGSWIGTALRPDTVLARHSLRLAVFTMTAVWLYKWFQIPRGYWIAFTIVVVLQPDYGSTRKRAAERIGGTIAGGLLAGLLLRITPPLYVLDALATVVAFFFARYLKTNYGLAIFFVTINLVLLNETRAAVHGEFMVTRVLSTLAGGALALLAARAFWPVWESGKFPPLLAAAIRANRTFLLSMRQALGLPPADDTDTVLMARRRAENANRDVAASVERMLGEPRGLRDYPERSAALATYNQRVTRALTALAVHLPGSGIRADPSVTALALRIGDLLEGVAEAVETRWDSPPPADSGTEPIVPAPDPDFGPSPCSPSTAASPACLAWVQLVKTMAELRAMTLGLNLNS